MSFCRIWAASQANPPFASSKWLDFSAGGKLPGWSKHHGGKNIWQECLSDCQVLSRLSLKSQFPLLLITTPIAPLRNREKENLWQNIPTFVYSKFKHHKEKKNQTQPNKKLPTQKSRRDLSKQNSLHLVLVVTERQNTHLSSVRVPVHKERTGRYNHAAGCTTWIRLVDPSGR